MNQIKNILLAVDFSDHSKLTLQSAINFCKETNCSLSIIHVIKNIDEIEEAEQNRCNRQVDEIAEFVQSHQVSVPHVKVVSGNIEENVVFFSESIQADAILLGTGNFHKHKKHRLGNHAEAILRLSSIPVLIVKDNPLSFKGKIACPIDLTVEADNVLNTAIAYAKNTNSELVIIHAIELPVYGYIGTGFNNLNPGQIFFKDASNAFSDYLKKFDLKGLSWSVKFLLGSPSEEITEFIKSQPFNMIIFGTASRSGISRFILGSVAETIVRNINSPCLVIKEKDNFGEIIII